MWCSCCRPKRKREKPWAGAAALAGPGSGDREFVDTHSVRVRKMNCTLSHSWSCDVGAAGVLQIKGYKSFVINVCSLKFYIFVRLMWQTS